MGFTVLFVVFLVCVCVVLYFVCCCEDFLCGFFCGFVLGVCWDGGGGG